MRMLQQLLKEGTDVLPVAQVRTWPHMEAFLIQNVAEYLYAQTTQEIWQVTKDFPSPVAPFPRLWLEHSRPSKIVSCVHGVHTSEKMPYRVGFLAETLTAESSRFAASYVGTGPLRYLPTRTPEVQDTQTAADLNDQATYVYPTSTEEVSRRLQDDGVKFVTTFRLFMQQLPSLPILGPLQIHELRMSAEGKPIDHVLHIPPGHRTTELAQADSMLWFAPLLALSFCNCKNVKLELQNPDKALERSQRERGIPIVNYKILRIEPIQAALRGEGAETKDPTALARALHICRGHFSHYEDKGLFGKYRGTFWINQHLRGKQEAGVILKDYEIVKQKRRRQA